ncbi:hypothetical protein BGZ54_001177 [Gamsiella multidivaricata]|nr:hypothetical protein BGZ54_001177 [Gamsiella multidivaricata]
MDLPEIRDIVVQYLDRGDLAKCSRLSKAWHGSVAAKVWNYVNLGGIHWKTPSFEALQHYGGLVKIFRVSLRFADWTAAEHSALNFPNLEKMVLTLSNAIASLPNLSSLHLRDVDIGHNAVALPKLRDLRLQYNEGNNDSETDQLQLICNCPALETLGWFFNFRSRWLNDPAPRNFVELAKAGTWRNLEALTMGWNGLMISDGDIASILAALPRLTILDLEEHEFGPLSFQILRRYFPVLKELRLDNCSNVTKSMLSEILSSCPKLSQRSRGGLAELLAELVAEGDIESLTESDAEVADEQ